jgi:type 1 fimbria pilin
MKRLSIVALGLLLAAGCSSSSSTPSSTGAGTSTVRFTATLKPSEETPAPITGAEASASGTSTMDFNITRDASSTITAATVNFTVTMQGFPSTSVVNIAHIHTGAAGVGGPILISTQVNPGDVTLTGGAGTFTRVGIGGFTAAQAQAILDNPAGFYFNVHTAANPGGVMRGQLVKQ